ncbi:hypothetical protein [Acinetobacter wuhouensis]|uniref:Uncharacterized protein n=1 Tax=Acinetobacter wuhouensis TaxID=1879050 RepID=A0A3G2T3V2_9GAMM|nr:hypothetical protein [Acinetobacter wuhouensis]AYO54416.1 hypothetical protein CDG68_12550 [Acinetobacter wuhouensis]
MSNLTEHQCKGKCPEFKEEQCNHCLVQDFGAKQWFDMPNHHLLEQSQACSLEQIEKREFDLGLAPDEAYVKCGESSPLFVSSLDDVEKYHRRAVEAHKEVS